MKIFCLAATLAVAAAAPVDRVASAFAEFKTQFGRVRHLPPPPTPLHHQVHPGAASAFARLANRRGQERDFKAGHGIAWGQGARATRGRTSKGGGA